jgi:alpha-1,3/alpha-1,6-mannosyltransferase
MYLLHVHGFREMYWEGFMLYVPIRFILLAIHVVYGISKEKQYDLFLCDQISACIPVLRRSQLPVLFYCHYPDQLLTKRESLAKKLYRWPIDAFEVSLFFV